MVAIVIGTKKTKLHELRTNSTGLSCDNFEPVKSFNQYAQSTKGPTQQVSLAILLEKIWNEVLAKFIIQIVARINPFFTAATTAATTAAAEISNVLLVE